MLSIINNSIKNQSSKHAIIYDNSTVTYGELDKMASYLAQKLYKFRNQPIGFCLNRGPENIIAMLAILRSGNYYVPLDKTYPLNRLKYIVNDTKMSAVIINIDHHQSESSEFIKFLKDSCELVIDLNEFKLSNISSNVWKEKNDVKIKKCKIAYVVYTSGTTGVPKGVIVSRVSLRNLITSAIRMLNLTETKILHYTSIGFDAAGWDIYIGLFTGGTIYMATEQLAISPTDCYKYVNDHCIDMITVTPAYISQFPLKHISTLKTIVIMGDKPDTRMMDF